jgi:hypothetical protein
MTTATEISARTEAEWAAINVAGSNRLPILATSINEHLKAAETATRHGLEHAIAAGLLLLEAKKLVDHGEWLAWLQANCRLGQRQAQTYMRLARNRHRLEAVKNAAAAHLTIGAAELLVGRPRPERRRGLPGQIDLLGGPEVTAEEEARETGLRAAEKVDTSTLLDFVRLVAGHTMTTRGGDGEMVYTFRMQGREFGKLLEQIHDILHAYDATDADEAAV